MKLCHDCGGELKQISSCFGHAWVHNRKPCLGWKPNLGHPANDLTHGFGRLLQEGRVSQEQPGGLHDDKRKTILQGRIVRLSKARLVLEGDSVQLAFNLGSCRFDYGPLDFVVWPGNRMGTANGLHIVTDRAHWLFLAERGDSPFLLPREP